MMRTTNVFISSWHNSRFFRAFTRGGGYPQFPPQTITNFVCFFLIFFFTFSLPTKAISHPNHTSRKTLGSKTLSTESVKRSSAHAPFSSVTNPKFWHWAGYEATHHQFNTSHIMADVVTRLESLYLLTRPTRRELTRLILRWQKGTHGLGATQELKGETHAYYMHRHMYPHKSQSVIKYCRVGKFRGRTLMQVSRFCGYSRKFSP